MPRIIGYGAFASVALAAYEFTGGTLKGYLNRPEVDEYERKEMLRQRRRRPIEETIAVIGEGRGESPCRTTLPKPAVTMAHSLLGIRPPGYEERRRERIKEKYGIEINPVCADPDAA